MRTIESRDPHATTEAGYLRRPEAHQAGPGDGAIACQEWVPECATGGNDEPIRGIALKSGGQASDFGGDSRRDGQDAHRPRIGRGVEPSVEWFVEVDPTQADEHSDFPQADVTQKWSRVGGQVIEFRDYLTAQPIVGLDPPDPSMGVQQGRPDHFKALISRSVTTGLKGSPCQRTRVLRSLSHGLSEASISGTSLATTLPCLVIVTDSYRSCTRSMTARHFALNSVAFIFI